MHDLILCKLALGASAGDKSAAALGTRPGQRMGTSRWWSEPPVPAHSRPESWWKPIRCNGWGRSRSLGTGTNANKKLLGRARRGSAVFRAAWVPYVFMRQLLPGGWACQAHNPSIFCLEGASVLTSGGHLRSKDVYPAQRFSPKRVRDRAVVVIREDLFILGGRGIGLFRRGWQVIIARLIDRAAGLRRPGRQA